MSMRDAWLGIDIGKTKIAIGLVSREGKVMASRSIPTRTELGGKQILKNCISLSRQILGKKDVRLQGMGIGTIGIVENGTIKRSSVKEWEGMDIKRIFEREFHVPATVESDVRAAALGEYLFGEGRNRNTFVYLTISSGVSFCTIRKGKIWQGEHRIAGIIGPAFIAPQGKSLESMFSGKGIVAMANKLRPGRLTTEEIFSMSRREESRYAGIIDNATEYAALTLAIIQLSIDPELIVVGGGVALNQKAFVKAAEKKAEYMISKFMIQLPRGIDIRFSKLGANAGVIGAASLAFDRKWAPASGTF